MWLRLIVMLTMCCAGTQVLAIPEQSGETATRADDQAGRIGDAQEFLREVNDAQAMALAGQYGSIKGQDVDRLKAAVATINRLLEGQQRATDLQADQRIELYNAQQEMVAILRNDDKSRMVCQNVRVTGSRVGKRECMTVAQREARARAARDSTARHQRLDCMPGDGNRCGNPITPLNPGG